MEKILINNSDVELTSEIFYIPKETAEYITHMINKQFQRLVVNEDDDFFIGDAINNALSLCTDDQQRAFTLFQLGKAYTKMTAGETVLGLINKYIMDC